MQIETRIKPAFAVIGKEGSTGDGDGFIQELWTQANEGFFEIYNRALRDEQGAVTGVWGAMTDFSRSFLPWEQGFTQGLYLAGVECEADALPPAGWVRWEIPGFEYLCVEAGETAFRDMLAYLEEQKIPLAGAVQDFTDPKTGTSWLYFPIRRL